MGYRGKTAEQAAARELRARGWMLRDIAQELGVAKSSVSLWVRDVRFESPAGRTGARSRGPNVLQRRKAAEVEECDAWGRALVGTLSERDLLIAGAALYAGEGAKGDGCVAFANTDPLLVGLFCRWLRTLFQVDETRLRCHLYLHQGLDLVGAVSFWADITGVPPNQFYKPYRAAPDAAVKTAKHRFGCISVKYPSTKTHRQIMGLVRALIARGG